MYVSNPRESFKLDNYVSNGQVEIVSITIILRGRFHREFFTQSSQSPTRLASTLFYQSIYIIFLTAAHWKNILENELIKKAGRSSNLPLTDTVSEQSTLAVYNNSFKLIIHISIFVYCIFFPSLCVPFSHVSHFAKKWLATKKKKTEKWKNIANKKNRPSLFLYTFPHIPQTYNYVLRGWFLYLYNHSFFYIQMCEMYDGEWSNCWIGIEY